MKHKRPLIRTSRPRQWSKRRSLMTIVPMNGSSRKRNRSRQRHSHKNAANSVRSLVAPSLAGRYEIVVKLRRFLSVEECERILQACKSLGTNTHKLVGPNRHDYDSPFPFHKAYRQIRLVSADSLLMLRLCIPDLIWRVFRVIDKPEIDVGSISSGDEE